MNTGTYIYGLLQYHHSQILGEVLNIGLIVYFPAFEKLEFIYPEKLIRLRFTYPNVPEKTIKAYLKHFKRRVEILNESKGFFSQLDLANSFPKFVESELLPSDSSNLQFGNYRTSVLYTPNLKHITDQLYNLYFSVFQHQENIAKRIDEVHLLNDYKKLLKQIGHQELSELKDNKKLKFDYSIEPSLGSKMKFDIAWTGSKYLHLVKPVSFDLIKQESILNKAYRFYGQFLDLENYAEVEKVNFDVLIAKPKRRELSKTYDKALELLEKPKRVTVIEQEEIKKYTFDTINSMNEF